MCVILFNLYIFVVFNVSSLQMATLCNYIVECFKLCDADVQNLSYKFLTFLYFELLLSVLFIVFLA